MYQAYCRLHQLKGNAHLPVLVNLAVAPKVVTVDLVPHTVAREIALQAAMRKRYAEVNKFSGIVSLYLIFLDFKIDSKKNTHLQVKNFALLMCAVPHLGQLGLFTTTGGALTVS